MPAGKLHKYGKRKRRKLPKVPYKKHKKGYKKGPYRKLGLTSMNPITRRHLTDVVKHVYQNNAIVTLPDWSTFYTAGTGTHRNLNQDFAANSINIFSENGFNGANTGNQGAGPTLGLAMFYANTVSSTYTAAGAATVMPGYSNQTPYMSNMYNHYQVLGTKMEFNIRVIPPLDATGKTEDYVPIKVMVIRCSDSTNINSSMTTETLESKPYVQSRILHNLQTNRNARIVTSHSPKKFNGIPKGQFISDARYLCQTNNPTSSNANVPEEQDHIKLVICPMNKLIANTLPATKKPPRLSITIKKTQWVRYSDPTTTNYNAVGTTNL